MRIFKLLLVPALLLQASNVCAQSNMQRHEDADALRTTHQLAMIGDGAALASSQILLKYLTARKDLKILKMFPSEVFEIYDIRSRKKQAIKAYDKKALAQELKQKEKALYSRVNELISKPKKELSSDALALKKRMRTLKIVRVTARGLQVYALVDLTWRSWVLLSDKTSAEYLYFADLKLPVIPIEDLQRAFRTTGQPQL